MDELRLTTNALHTTRLLYTIIKYVLSGGTADVHPISVVRPVGVNSRLLANAMIMTGLIIDVSEHLTSTPAMYLLKCIRIARRLTTIAREIMVCEVSNNLRNAFGDISLDAWDIETKQLDLFTHKVNAILDLITETRANGSVDDACIQSMEDDIQMYLSQRDAVHTRRKVFTRHHCRLSNQLNSAIRDFNPIGGELADILERLITQYESVFATPERHLTSSEYQAVVTVKSAGHSGDALCAICQESITRRHVQHCLPCNHMFHARCLRKYLCHTCVSPSCPLCRRDLLVDVDTVRSEGTNSASSEAIAVSPNVELVVDEGRVEAPESSAQQHPQHQPRSVGGVGDRANDAAASVDNDDVVVTSTAAGIPLLPVPLSPIHPPPPPDAADE